ncbi:MAG TPA: hypothetical protein VFF68_13065, partial [Anaerolineaceae bacterium]|nr:hypothetical protein [Anaerolineaceae bacterium]
ARPIHLTTSEERKSKIPLDQLRIDLGPGGAGKAKPGDRATFATRFQQAGPSLIGKALDDRIGVATLIELVKHAPANVELLAAFTVQEEVGLRGARVAAHRLNPDVGLAIDSTPSYDLPTWDDSENAVYNTRLGEGPAIYLADSHTLSDPRLTGYLAQVAADAGIRYQYRQPGGGGTDAGAIHKARGGVPSASVSVPGRYAHTAVMISRLDDWQNMLALLYTALERMPHDLLKTER